MAEDGGTARLSRRRLLGGAAAFGAAALHGTDRTVAGDKAMAGLAEDTETAFADALRPYVARGEVPGIVALAARGEDVVVAVLGNHDFGTAPPMRRDTIFRIASLTKPVARAAAMILADEGLIALDEPIDRLLPEFAWQRVLRSLDAPLDDTVPAARAIRVDDLLNMTMGVGAIMLPGEYPINAAMAERRLSAGAHLPPLPSMDAYAEALASLPLMRQPGEAWLYDTPIQLLGVLLERAAGQPLEALMTERLFEPLGMKDTAFSVPAEKLDRLPACYWRNYQTGVVEVFDETGPASRFARPPGFASAAGGLVSTVDDYAAFARMMLNGGAHAGRQIMPAAAVAAMTTDQITPAQKAVSPFAPGFWEERGWGYGLSVIHRPVPDGPVGLGWDGGYGTSGYWDPETGLTGVLMTQRLMESPEAPPVFRDFWRTARAAAAA